MAEPTGWLALAPRLPQLLAVARRLAAQLAEQVQRADLQQSHSEGTLLESYAAGLVASERCWAELAGAR